ncbi:MAG: response regulator transcription factor [Rhodopseudomonas sp.]|uniref:response regulator n=1 Tax=Rhodopseudomonas sp. TaxID=1078 RepID=UPI0018334317|nr:response regulator transcription factor [Rhodopseudomonas sp.]NVN88054.1 response regulator transcription factor [Rhodopseudomonas sp.]
MTTKSRIFVADDHPLILAGLHRLIAAEADFEVVGEAETGPAALDGIRRSKPDAAIVDIALPGMDGIMLTRHVGAEMPKVRILILSVSEDRTYLTQAIEAGARGYLVERSAAANLAIAIRVVLVGGLYIDPAVAFRTLNRPSIFGATETSAIRELSERETQVLKLCSHGLTNREISARVGVKTIETFKARGLNKLDIKSRADLVRYASRIGWLADM